MARSLAFRRKFSVRSSSLMVLPRWVPVQMDFSSLIPALNANRIDIVANTLSIRKARCQQIAFSNPEFNAREGFGVLKGNPKNIHSFADIARIKDARLGHVVGGFQTTYAEIAG